MRYGIMRKLLNFTLSIFVITMIFSALKVFALRQIAVENVTVPILSGRVTAKYGIVKETASTQGFNTTTSRYAITNEEAVVKVETHNSKNGKDSGFVNAPKDSIVTIPNPDLGVSTLGGASYNLIAKNSENSVLTVAFFGLWLIDR